MKIDKIEFNQHLKNWENIAKRFKWYKKPFYIQVWIDKDGKIVDSISNTALTRHHAIDANTDEEIQDFQIV